MRVPFETMCKEFERVLLKKGFSADRAVKCARSFAEASLDGVYTHGLNRFPRFIEYIGKGLVDIHAEPTLVTASGCIEQWDGNIGPGNLNAVLCMDRAIALAKEHGMGCVGLKNTNHWMRGGNYGWQAANAGCVGICWSNTMPNLPPWGATENKLGNNPLIIAIPRKDGHIVLDMAMSQFSNGQIESHCRHDELLPVIGGFDTKGELTRDPHEIEASKRCLPIGYWKGSGLSLVLDLLAVMLSGGLSTFRVGQQAGEQNLSQVFIAIDPCKVTSSQFIEKAIEEVIDDMHNAACDRGHASFPGERTKAVRLENLEKGIPVDEGYWQKVLSM